MTSPVKPTTDVSKNVRLTMEYGEVWITPTEFIVCGQPKEDDPEHNCDALGCTSVSHVLFRTRLEPQAIGLTSLRTQLQEAQEDAARAENALREAEEQLRCPDCGCATQSEAESKECGCDSPVCAAALGKTLAQHYVDALADLEDVKRREQTAKNERDKLNESLELSIESQQSLRTALAAAEERARMLEEKLSGCIKWSDVDKDEWKRRYTEEVKTTVRLTAEVEALNGLLDDYLTGRHPDAADDPRWVFVRECRLARRSLCDPTLSIRATHHPRGGEAMSEFRFLKVSSPRNSQCSSAKLSTLDFFNVRTDRFFAPVYLHVESLLDDTVHRVFPRDNGNDVYGIALKDGELSWLARRPKGGK